MSYICDGFRSEPLLYERIGSNVAIAKGGCMHEGFFCTV